MSSNQNVLRSHTYQYVLASMLFIVVMIGSLSACGSNATPSPGGSSGTWKIVPSPNAGLASSLSGVTASSASDVWAVGYSSGSKSQSRTLIEHWNGSQWSVVPSPNPDAISSELRGVTASSASDVWAVGSSRDPDSYPYKGRTLIEHWNGTRWSIVPSPSLGPFWNMLSGVTASSASGVWAVGDTYTTSNPSSCCGSRTLIEHWNGTQWSVVPSPNPEGLSGLSGVTAISASDVWAVGLSGANPFVIQSIIEHWNGTTWSVVSSPKFWLTSSLSGVTASSASDVWAVGSSDSNNHQGICCAERTLIEHWNGSQWSVVPSPNPGTPGPYVVLPGVAAVSASNVWAIGAAAAANSTNHIQTLVEHWNGTR